MPDKPTYEELEKRVRELETAESEQKHLEKKLIHQHELIDYIISHARSSIAVHDKDLNYLYVSKRYLEEYKVANHDVIGKHHYEVFPDLPQKWRDVHQRSLKGEVLSDEDDPYYRDDGSVDWTRWECRPWYDVDGSIGGIIIFTEITNDLRQIEKALKESEERYSLATKGGNVGVWDWNLITGHMFVSPHLKKMLGYEDREIKNHIDDWGKHVYSGDVERVMEEANACIEGAKSEYRVEHRMVHKDGSIRWFLASGMVERDAAGKAIRFLGTDTDITGMKELEEKLRRRHKMEALGTLSGGIAHEFNNILGIILGNTELAFDDVPDWNPAKDCLKEIRVASLRAKDVVRQIMSFSRKSPATRKPVKLSRIIQESLKLVRATIPSSIEIHQEILCDDELILANPTEINQVFLNLCSNSVDALEKGTGRLKIRLETVAIDSLRAPQYNGLTPGDYVKLTVRDDGAGIDPELMDLVFDPYFTTKDVDKGLGMGLAVVYGIVKKHDGAIKINSAVGKGTSVEVFFPIARETTNIERKVSEALPGGTE